VIERAEGVLTVPVGALWREGEGWAVFAVQDGRARKRAVQVQGRNALEARVAGGLAAGERVVVYPSDAIRDGARLDLRDAKASGR